MSKSSDVPPEDVFIAMANAVGMRTPMSAVLVDDILAGTPKLQQARDNIDWTVDSDPLDESCNGVAKGSVISSNGRERIDFTFQWSDVMESPGKNRASFAITATLNGGFFSVRDSGPYSALGEHFFKCMLGPLYGEDMIIKNENLFRVVFDAQQDNIVYRMSKADRGVKDCIIGNSKDVAGAERELARVYCESERFLRWLVYPGKAQGTEYAIRVNTLRSQLKLWQENLLAALDHVKSHI